MAQGGYRVALTPAAQRDIAALPRAVQQRIRPKIDALAEEPRTHGAVKMAGGEDLWRIRVGSYRVVYTIQDDVLLVLVVRVRHRREAYR